jgi:hypothetical protein
MIFRTVIIIECVKNYYPNHPISSRWLRAYSRTTDVCEGYHSVIKAHFKQRHPDPYGFIVFLQQQDVMLERRIAQLQVGAPSKKRRAK